MLCEDRYDPIVREQSRASSRLGLIHQEPTLVDKELRGGRILPKQSYCCAYAPQITRLVTGPANARAKAILKLQELATWID